MNCPKCDEGVIIRIRFKDNGKNGYVCDFCEALWFEDENINIHSGHALQSFMGNNDLSYTIEELHEKDQDHQPIVSKKDTIVKRDY